MTENGARLSNYVIMKNTSGQLCLSTNSSRGAAAVPLSCTDSGLAGGSTREPADDDFFWDGRRVVHDYTYKVWSLYLDYFYFF